MKIGSLLTHLTGFSFIVAMAEALEKDRGGCPSARNQRGDPMLFGIGLAAAGLSLVVGSAHAQDRVWIGDTHEEGASLIYGTPESGDIALSFSCARSSGKVSFSYLFEPIDATDDVRVEVTLEAGDIILPVQTTGARLEMDDLFVLEGQIAFDTPLVELLTSQGALEVFVEDGSEEIPLEGARQAVRNLVETCPVS